MHPPLKILLCVALLLSVVGAGVAYGAEPFDTRHRISLRLGYHNFFPDTSDHEGTRPDGDPVVTEEEWAYIWEEGYRIQDFDGPTLELGYEYKFLRWFGLALDIGFYGGEKKYDFTIAGFDIESQSKINVFHMDLTPCFHWTTRWTDLYGGPTLGIYTTDAEFDLDIQYGPHSFSESSDDQGDGFGWGMMVGFEFRISRHFGVAIEDRLNIAVINEFKPEDEGPLNVGGNVFTLCGVIHL